MLTLPLEQLKEKITSSAKIPSEELDERIKKKMDELAGLISEEGAAHIVANELGVQLLSMSMLAKVGSLAAGARNIDVLGKVVRKYEVRSFQTARGSGKVGSFVLGDETGTIRAVLWQQQADNLERLNNGDVVKIRSSYVRDNNGVLELHLNDRSELTINPEGEKVNIAAAAEKTPEAQRKALAELKENDQNIEVLVTLVDVFDPRFFTVCPECNRRVFEKDGGAQCASHGAVVPALSYVLNALGDDGSDTIRIVLWKSQAERLLGMGSADITKFKDFPEQFQDVKHRLLGEMVKFVGKVTKNTMFDRLEFSAQLVFLNPSPDEELKRLESKPKQE